MPEELRMIWLLAITLGLACFFGYLAQLLRQSPILGYLLAGYLIGPNSPGLVVDTYIAEQLASIGVTLLMFTIGLSFQWKDLMAVKKIALPGALILSSISIAVGAFYSVYLGETFVAGLVVGLAICVSSTVVIVRVLSDQGLLHTLQGHITIGWTIVEDLISVFGLLLLPAFVVSGISSTNNQAINIFLPFLWVIIKVITLALFIHYFGEKVIEKILRVIARTRSHELFTLAVLACVFLIALGSSYVFGVSLALGAFIAGTIVGKTDMSHQAAANALPMRDTFAVVFFVSVGMLFSPMAVMNNVSLFLGLLIVLLILRPFLAFVIVKIAKYPIPIAFTVALSLAQIGEYSFILAEEGSRLGILPDNAYDILVACAFITIGLNPILFQLFRSVYKKRLNWPSSSKVNLDDFSSDLLDDSTHKNQSFLTRIVVVGYGPIGKKTSYYLQKKGYHVLVIDQNVDTISSLNLKEMEKIFGDASQYHILEQAQLKITRLLVITIPDYVTTQLIIQTARSINPFIQIVTRSHYQADFKNNRFPDIINVCDEEASADKLIKVVFKTLRG